MSKEKVTELIQAMVEGKASHVEDTFKDIMAERISAKLEEKRQELAKNMFKEAVQAEDTE